MRLAELAAAITDASVTEPWSFTGACLRDTLARVCLPTGRVAPPFTDDFDLADPFILVEHVGHVPESTISGFATQRELESAILAGCGFLNDFTTHCLVFAHGRLKRFQIWYRDEAGAERVFSKTAQIDADDFSTRYAEPRIEWL
jgi:hypothetical protein